MASVSFPVAQRAEWARSPGRRHVVRPAVSRTPPALPPSTTVSAYGGSVRMRVTPTTTTTTTTKPSSTGASATITVTTTQNRHLWISRPFPVQPQESSRALVQSKAVVRSAAPALSPPRGAPPRQHPARERPDSALIWLHGLGDTEEGWKSILEEFLPGRCKLVTPRAPLNPVTCNDGESMTCWFDMETLPIDARCLPPNHGCSVQDLIIAAKTVHAIINDLVESGISSDRIVIGGFSQGGAVALFSSLTSPYKVAGCIVFSGLFLCHDTFPRWAHPANTNLDVLWCHGSKDEAVHPSLQQEGCDALAQAGVSVKRMQFSGGHCYHPDARGAILTSLRSWFGHV